MEKTKTTGRVYSRSVLSMVISATLGFAGNVNAETVTNFGMAGGGGGGTTDNVENIGFGGKGGKTALAQGGEGGKGRYFNADPSMNQNSGGGGASISSTTLRAGDDGYNGLHYYYSGTTPTGTGAGGGGNGQMGVTGKGGAGGEARYATDNLAITGALEMAGGDGGGVDVSRWHQPAGMTNGFLTAATGGKGGSVDLQSTTLQTDIVTLKAGNGGDRSTWSALPDFITLLGTAKQDGGAGGDVAIKTTTMVAGDVTLTAGNGGDGGLVASTGANGTGGKGGNVTLIADALTASRTVTLTSGVVGTTKDKDGYTLHNGKGGAGGDVIFRINQLSASILNIIKNSGNVDFQVGTLIVPKDNNVTIDVRGSDAASFRGQITTLQLNGTGKLVGAGAFTISKVKLQGGTINASNAALLGQVQAAIQLGSAGGVFDASQGALNINKPLTGSGGAVFSGAGNTRLSVASQGIGRVSVNATTLDLAAANALATHSAVTMQNGATLNTGAYQQTVRQLTGDNSTMVNVDEGGELVLAGASDSPAPRLLRSTLRTQVSTLNTSGTINNRSRITLRNKLTVNGDWNSRNGKLHLDPNNSTETFRNMLTISGKTTGTTLLSFANLNGSLAGVPFINAKGLTEKSFVSSGDITGGGVLYTMSVNGNGIALQKKTSEGGRSPTLAAYTGSYVNNAQAAATLFSQRLADRFGAARYASVEDDRLSTDSGSMWLRLNGAHQKSHQGDNQVATTGNSLVVQGGGEFLTLPVGSGSVALGAMAGYGHVNSTSKTRSADSDGRVDGYSVGLYSTWYQNGAGRAGAYADSWVQYGWFDNQVNNAGRSDRYDANGVSASLEAGYHLPLWQQADTRWFQQPQAQVTWSGIQADTHRAPDGSRVSQNDDHTLQTRLGARLYAVIPAGKTLAVKPFVEANWLHNSSDYGMQFDETTVKQNGSDNTGEVRVGLDGQLNASLAIWGYVGQQRGSHSYTQTEGSLGVRYQF